MPIVFTCPGCGEPYSVAEKFAGKTAKCKGCEQVFVVPAAPVPPQSARARNAPRTDHLFEEPPAQ